MMFDFLAIIMILIMALGCAVFLDCKIGKTIPLVVSVIICIELGFGFIDHLEFGFYSIVVFFAVCVYCVLKEYKTVCNRINIHVVLLFFVVWAALEIHHADSFAYTWDELSQWAVTVKYSYTTDLFAAHIGSNAIYPDYPPASAMFHYFWMNIGNGWQDNRLYVSMGIMMIAFLLPILDEINIKHQYWYAKYIVDFILVSVILSIYPNAYASLTVDCLMGIWFAWLLYNVILEKNSRLKIFNLLIGSLGLVLVKKSAVIFVAFALILWFANIIIEKNKQWVFLLITSITVFFERYLWVIYVKKQAIPTTFDMNGGTEPYEWRKQALINFYKALINYSVVGDTSQTIFWINRIKVPAMVVIALLMLCGYIASRHKRKNSVYIVMMFVELFIYIAATSYLYYHSFSEVEDSVLSSMNRYIGTFLLALILFFLYLFLQEYTITKKHILILVLLCFVPCYDPKYLFTKSIMPQYKVEKDQAFGHFSEYEEYALFIKDHVDIDSRIHFFNGDICLMNYILTPIRVTSTLWQESEFGWFESYSSNYEYVFFDNTYGSIETEEFVEKYGYLFTDTSLLYDHGLYKVVYEDGQPRLQYIDRFKKG